MPTILVRERPPLRLSLDVLTPADRRARWGNDDPNPANAPSGLTFTTTIPGGFENLSCVLQRNPARGWTDLEELSTVTAYGAGSQVAWQGRIEQLPAAAGDQEQITPTCVGWQSHLADDDSAREVFVDCDLTNWIGPSVGRQIAVTTANETIAGASVSPDFTNGYPSLATEISGPWTQTQLSEGWYDARGLPIGLLYGAWQTAGGSSVVTPGSGGWLTGMFLSSDDLGTATDSRAITSTPGQATLTPTVTRPWALVQLAFVGAGGTSGVTYPIFWTSLAVYGTHGLPLQGSATANTAQGILASDIIAYAVGRWAPKLAMTTGADGTIQPSSFVIPQLAYLDPTTVSQMITDATQYELLDWAVWEGGGYGPAAVPTFYCNARGARGNSWIARSGPAQLQDAGPQISNLYNGVIVQFTDVSGENRTYGPPGSGANMIDASLVDADPSNPANQAGINRWALVTMGTTTFPGALQIGQRFLQEQLLLNTSGSATLIGHVLDTHGVYWPAWMVRGGDTISFIDASDTSPRRVISTSYDDSTKTNTVQLDQPPNSLQALLERLSIVLSPIGLA